MYSAQLALALWVLGITCTVTLSAPLEQRQESGPVTREQQINYLKKYGHWRGTERNGEGADEDLKSSLLAFQSYYGLKTTGEFDDSTKKLMAAPRCGNSDDNEATGRQKRYVYSGSKWSTTALTFRIENYTTDLPMNEARSVLIHAFKIWSDASPLTFTETTSGKAYITIAFVPRDHAHGKASDGVMAHAVYPPWDVSIHFMEEIDWMNDNSTGYQLLYTAVHEIGHSLGLGHSSLRSAIMYSYYRNKDLDHLLDADDIEGIQFIYGKPLSTIPPANQNSSPIDNVVYADTIDPVTTKGYM